MLFLKESYPAVVLSGGGAKGAYQIGVMKAMAERGLLEKMECIAGTSVGALNALLFAIGDAELAEDIWECYVNEGTMLKNIDLLNHSLSRDSLLAMFRLIGVSRIRNRAEVYVYAHSLERGEPVPFLLNDKSESEMIDLLLASSALPRIYPSVRIGNEEFIDGGVTALGNHPVRIPYEKGFRKILLSALSHDFNPHALKALYDKEKQDLFRSFPDAELQIIKPHLDIGKFFSGTINFSAEEISRRIAIGYDDGCQFFRMGGVLEMNINDEIRYRADAVIHDAIDFEDFVSTANFRRINAKLPTMGGKVFYENIFECDGWRIQWHSGLLKFHYRILDAQNVRRAYTYDPKELLAALILYADRKKRF